jgi:hypothetical protein
LLGFATCPLSNMCPLTCLHQVPEPNQPNVPPFIKTAGRSINGPLPTLDSDSKRINRHLSFLHLSVSSSAVSFEARGGNTNDRLNLRVVMLVSGFIC